MSVKEIVANSSTRNICEHLIIVWKFWFRETYDDSNTWNIWCAADLSLNRDISIKLVLIFSHVIFFIKLGKFVTFYDDYDFLAGLEQFYLLEVFLAEIDLFSSCSLMINATGKHNFWCCPKLQMFWIACFQHSEFKIDAIPFGVILANLFDEIGRTFLNCR